MRAFLIVLAIVGVPCIADAQPPKLESVTGQYVEVTDHDKREWRGLLISVSPDALVIQDHEGQRAFALDKIRRVARDGDSVRDGALKGALLGVLFGMLAVPTHPDARSMIGGALAFGLVGAGLDGIHQGKRTIYRGKAPQLGFTIKW